MTTDRRRPIVPLDQRTALPRPMSPMQQVVAELIAEGHGLPAIADAFSLSSDTIHEHAKRAANLLPSTLPRSLKLSLWCRGYDLREFEDLPTGLYGNAGLGDPRAPAPGPIDAETRIRAIIRPAKDRTT